MHVSVVIPAINEEESLGQVLAAIPRDAITEILLVDGGSTDNTTKIAENAGARVIREHQRGYGRACAAGVREASGEIVVFVDADGADDPSGIPELISPILSGEADMVLGSRLAGKVHSGAMPFQQRFGNWLSAVLIRLLYGLQITDLSPFRAVLRDKVNSLDMQEMTYGWPTEMIAKAAKGEWRIVEIPVHYHPRIGGESKISGTLRGTILATYYILTTIIRYSRG
jgi:glycosyltransferase involved in cell wall biosynthesis